MSVVTGVMLICSLVDSDEVVPEINAWLAKLDVEPGSYELRDVADEGSGGFKHPQFGGLVRRFQFLRHACRNG